MSDGRDARDVLSRVAELAAQEDKRESTWLERVFESQGLPGKLVGAAAFKFDSEVTRLHRGLTDDDRETLLRTANEIWTIPHRQGDAVHTSLREDYLIRLKRDVAPGTQTTVFRHVVKGETADWRDAETLARTFVNRVEALAAWRADGDLAAAIETARDEVLGNTPLPYRTRVLEKVLDIEEQRLRDSGASPDEVSALEEQRSERRAQGWRYLGQNDLPSRGR